MSVSHKLRSLAWKKDASWREVAVIAAAIVLAFALVVLGSER